MSLTIENLHKSYDGLRILKDINIASEDGEFLALVGASGCGKSTLLSCIGGLEEIDSGKVFNGGKDITALSPKERDIAMVFQSYALYPNMTAQDNIAFGLKMKKQPAAEIARKIKEVADILQIVDLLDRKPAQMSGGQKQRVAMGRAIARDPSLYLFDEPLSNLDAKLRVDMRLEIKKLHKRTRKNVVYVTHDQIEAMTLADRIAIMKDGCIVQIGAPEEVYFRPKNIFVAKFIGSNPINLLRVKLTTDQNRLVFFVTPGDAPAVPVPVPERLASYRDKEVIVGIRPESINSPADGEKAKITSAVELEEKTGADSYVFTSWNGIEIKARCATPTPTPPAVDLWLYPENLLFFDPNATDEARIA